MVNEPFILLASNVNQIMSSKAEASGYQLEMLMMVFVIRDFHICCKEMGEQKVFVVREIYICYKEMGM